MQCILMTRLGKRDWDENRRHTAANIIIQSVTRYIVSVPDPPLSPATTVVYLKIDKFQSFPFEAVGV